MRKVMNQVRSLISSLWSDESAQGATEYILLLVIVVALALTFRTKIMGLVKGKLDEVGGGMDKLKPDEG